MEDKKILSAEEVLAGAREACHDALKCLTAIDGVNVHAAVSITVHVTSYCHSFQSEDSQALREKVYQVEAELMDAHPDVLFNFEVH